MSEENHPKAPVESSPKGGAEGENGSTDYVKHSTYVGVIDEVKNVKSKLKGALAELNEYRVKEQQLQEQKMIEEKKYLEVIESLKAEKERLAGEVNTHLQDKLDYRKMTAAMSVMQAKGINLESKYFGLLPIDQIAITDDGDIDSNSVANVIENFQKEHPRLTLPTSKLLPNDKSGSMGPMISTEQWKKLGPEERKQALKEKRVKSSLL